jgi:hypothetical protein
MAIEQNVRRARQRQAFENSCSHIPQRLHLSSPAVKALAVERWSRPALYRQLESSTPAFGTRSSEAKARLGDAAVLREKYVEKPALLEVQMPGRWEWGRWCTLGIVTAVYTALAPEGGGDCSAAS